jgi:hypothetical protein
MAGIVPSSFETLASLAPQDEVKGSWLAQASVIILLPHPEEPDGGQRPASGVSKDEAL